MKQKGIMKRVLCLLLIACFIMTSFNVGSVQTQAAAKDVTNSVSGKHNIKALCNCFPSLCGSYIVEEMEVGQKKKFDFSKESARRDALEQDYYELYDQYNTGISKSTLSKRIFGKDTSKINFNIGEWGEQWPEIKVKKIYKLSSSKYQVKADVEWNGMYVYKIGSATITLKKKPKSYYGYIVKSMTLKKVAD